MKEQVSIQGKNFYGSVKHNADFLQFDLTEFRKGEKYTAIIAQVNLQENQKQYFPFTKIIDLLLQITSNQNLTIANQGLLLIPISITYKEKRIHLTVKLRLTKFSEDETTKFQNLVQLVEVLAKQKKQLEKQGPKLIQFRGDEVKLNFNQYQLNKSLRKLKKISRRKDLQIYNHYEYLPKTGVFQFKFKVLRLNSFMCFGICKRSICDRLSIEKTEPGYVGVHLNNGNIQVYKSGEKVHSNAYDDHVASKQGNDSAEETEVKDEESGLDSSQLKKEFRQFFDSNQEESSKRKDIFIGDIFKVEINMDKNHITWYQNSTIIATQLINEVIISERLYPFVTLNNKDDQIEFIYK